MGTQKAAKSGFWRLYRAVTLSETEPENLGMDAAPEDEEKGGHYETNAFGRCGR